MVMSALTRYSWEQFKETMCVLDELVILWIVLFFARAKQSRIKQEDSEIFMSIPEHPLSTLERQRNNERVLKES
jgi:hypothetical protein